MRAEYDLFVIGGGINGCGIARDAAGRGLSVCLAEMNDLGSATSSASSKLFHGGLRYLEYFEFRLVREALIEREILLQAMPHISWPMRFVVPFHKSQRFDLTTPTSKLLSLTMPWMKGRRPSWLIRFGLFLYDNLGGRKILPATTKLELHTAPEGRALQSKFERAYEYSDCWVEDSRLVVLNARDAEMRGAKILPHTKVTSAAVRDGLWHVTVQDASGETREITAKMVVNAAGPWVEQVMRGTLRSNQPGGVRLVRGSHIVVKRLFDHDKCYLFQGTDGRIMFAIPYETDFTLIGTTDAEHSDPDTRPECTPAETGYILDFINGYVDEPVTQEDIVWQYAGVRPLFNDGATSASALTRDYVLKLDQGAGAPSLTIFGGKITTYRKLAESAMDEIAKVLPVDGPEWTADAPLPGGDFPVDGVGDLVADLQARAPFLDDPWALRLVRAYGTDAAEIVKGASAATDLGKAFGATLTEAEVRWLMTHEYARSAADVVWRRSKLGLRMTDREIATLGAWMAQAT